MTVSYRVAKLGPGGRRLLSVTTVRVGNGAVSANGNVRLIYEPPIVPSHSAVIVRNLHATSIRRNVDCSRVLTLLLPFVGGQPVIKFYPRVSAKFLGPLIGHCVNAALPGRIVSIQRLCDQHVNSHARNVPARSRRLNGVLTRCRVPGLKDRSTCGSTVVATVTFLRMH